MREFTHTFSPTLKAILLASTIASTGCTYSAYYRNLNSYHTDGPKLIKRNSGQAETASVLEGQATWVVLRRVCVTEVGSWIGARELNVGITLDSISSGKHEVGKGVVSAEEVRNNDCLPFKNNLVIDPFVFRRGTYRVTLDIVELPSENAKLLASLARSVVPTASLASANPAAKVGTALFDAFIQPAIDNDKLSHVRFTQDFEAIELQERLSDPDATWQTGDIILLPRNGRVNGEDREFQIDPDTLYVDANGSVRPSV